MQIIATDIPVSLSRGFVRLWCAKTAMRTEVLFEMNRPTVGESRGMGADLMQPLPNYFGLKCLFDSTVLRTNSNNTKTFSFAQKP